MIKINFKDGSTLDLDLFDDKQLEDYKKKLENPFFVKRISGMSIYRDKRLYTIQKPDVYETLYWECGKIAIAKMEGSNYCKAKDVGECINLIIDKKIKHSLIYYFSNKMIKSKISFLENINVS